MTGTVAVIGAGMAGLAAATELCRSGVRVQVFDKGRRPGGRVSTRVHPGFFFDHGCPYFTAGDSEFVRVVASWEAKGWIAAWPGRFVRLSPGGPRKPVDCDEARWVGVGGMGTFAARVAEALPVHSGVAITSITGGPGSWRLHAADQDLGAFSKVLVAVPPPQVAALFAGDTFREVASIGRVDMNPCWAVMAGFGERLNLPFDAVEFDDDVLVWSANQRSKPGGCEGEAWVLHATLEWSASHLESSGEGIAELLLHRWHDLLGTARVSPVHLAAHRWRFARPARIRNERFHLDAERGIGLCGDGLRDGRVEGAYLSGLQLARALLHEDRSCQQTP
ncbi:MAG TPA: FAD-dependent oxidoreductase [Kiritimatiellia bacterium]|nr:FAD-dependent oxidoreductase [Kiritimatiellia bacterium]